MTKLIGEYRHRSSAVRQARQACKAALRSEIYEAFEGPDFGIHPTRPKAEPHAFWEERFAYELRGPALDAQKT